MKKFTRAQLYDLVWSESRLALAKKLGVSDVWIRKACLRSDIPVPPPGYWARKAAGKKTVRPPLPPRAFGRNDAVELGRANHSGAEDSDEIPPVARYDEDLESVRRRAELCIQRQSVPRGFQRTVAGIQKLLDADERRRAAGSTWDTPRFDCPAAVRRLRVLNALLVVLQGVGCRAGIAEEDLGTSVSVGDMHVKLELTKGLRKPVEQARPRLVLADRQKESLMLTLSTYLDHQRTLKVWEDEPERKLEQRVHEIAVDVLVAGEVAYRAWVDQQREWRIEDKARREAEQLQRKLEAERKEAERFARLERERRDHLIALADNLRKSEDIRSLVAAVCSREQLPPELEAWRGWALAVASSLDPRLAATDRLFLKSAMGS